MTKSEKEFLIDLDDLKDEICNLELLVQGFIFSINENTNNKRQEDVVLDKIMDIDNRVGLLTLCFNNEE